MTNADTADTVELLPCPFCGGKPIKEEIPADDPEDPNAGGCCIACQGCGACTVLVFPCGDEIDGILAEKWNRRTAPVPSGAAEALEPPQPGPVPFPDKEVLERDQPACLVAPDGPWRVYWHGSPPERGDHVMLGRTEIAYLGDQHHEAVHDLVYQHNCAVAHLRAATPPAAGVSHGEAVEGRVYGGGDLFQRLQAENRRLHEALVAAGLTTEEPK